VKVLQLVVVDMLIIKYSFVVVVSASFVFTWIGMLSNSCYEETLLQATARLLSTDLHHSLKKQLAASNKGISSHSLLCAVCRNFLHVLKDDDYDIVFRYHFNFYCKISKGKQLSGWNGHSLTVSFTGVPTEAF
jgi:hypothetical protein